MNNSQILKFNIEIGPLIFKSLKFSLKTHLIFLLFQNECFFIFFDFKNEKENIEKFVYSYSIIIYYKNILNIESFVKTINIELKEEPEWKNLQHPQQTSFQRSGFLQISFTSKKNIIFDIRSILFLKCSSIFQIKDPNLILEKETFSNAIPFEFPDLKQENFTIFLNLANKSLSNPIYQANFMDKFGYLLDISPQLLVNEAIDPIYSILESKKFIYNQQIFCFFRDPIKFFINSEWCILKDIEADKFSSTPLSGVLIFRSSTSLKNISFINISKLIKSFIISGSWQYFEEISDLNSISLWMTEIYGRNLWISPVISFEFLDSNSYIISFNSIKSENFVENIRSLQKFGKFKKGIGCNWLPDVYCTVLYINKNNNNILNLYLSEVISWDFDPELNGTSINDLAKNRSLILTHLSSFLEANNVERYKSQKKKKKN